MTHTETTNILQQFNAKSEPTARLFAQDGSTDGLCHTGEE